MLLDERLGIRHHEAHQALQQLDGHSSFPHLENHASECSVCKAACAQAGQSLLRWHWKKKISGEQVPQGEPATLLNRVHALNIIMQPVLIPVLRTAGCTHTSSATALQHPRTTSWTSTTSIFHGRPLPLGLNICSACKCSLKSWHAGLVLNPDESK